MDLFRWFRRSEREPSVGLDEQLAAVQREIGNHVDELTIRYVVLKLRSGDDAFARAIGLSTSAARVRDEDSAPPEPEGPPEPSYGWHRLEIPIVIEPRVQFSAQINTDREVDFEGRIWIAMDGMYEHELPYELYHGKSYVQHRLIHDSALWDPMTRGQVYFFIDATNKSLAEMNPLISAGLPHPDTFRVNRIGIYPRAALDALATADATFVLQVEDNMVSADKVQGHIGLLFCFGRTD